MYTIAAVVLIAAYLFNLVFLRLKSEKVLNTNALGIAMSMENVGFMSALTFISGMEAVEHYFPRVAEVPNYLEWMRDPMFTFGISFGLLVVMTVNTYLRIKKTAPLEA